MKKLIKVTEVVTVAAIFIILGYDCFALAKGGTEATISHMIITASYSYPLIPFFGGAVSSHFWWRMRDTAETKKIADNTRS
jgi:hypothetical protein